MTAAWTFFLLSVRQKVQY